MGSRSAFTSLACFLWHFMIIISLLAHCSSSEQDRGTRKRRVSSILHSPPGSQNLKSFENEDVIGEDDGNSSSNLRGKRRLVANEISKKVIMLLFDKDKNINETYEHIKFPNTSTFETVDFIVRLQEKYEYTTCTSYLHAAKEATTNYFHVEDEDLVNIPNDEDKEFKGDQKSRERRRQEAIKSLPKRYRLHGEPCDPEEEWFFWRDMFLAAENDTIAIPKGSGIVGGGGGSVTPGPNVSSTTPSIAPGPGPGLIAEEYDYVKIPPGDMMHNWNKIWRSYERKGVCNQRYLLECDEDSGTCKCRTNGVGLSTMIFQKDVSEDDDSDDIFTTQYYEDLKENDKGEVKVHYGEYLHKKKCVLTVNLPKVQKDIFITNPCDFFLPMIGVCRTDCVVNATCNSVNEKEKDAMAARNQKIDYYERIINYTLHETYHQKCVCKVGKICRKVKSLTYGGATTFRKAPLLMNLTNLHLFCLFQTILAAIMSFKY